MLQDNLCAIVLAAGKGTRMRSALPKVLHRLLGKPIVCHVLDLLYDIGVNKILLVLGHGAEQVQAGLGGRVVDVVLQREQLGTGHAVMCCREVLDEFVGHCLIMCGDTPLFTRSCLDRFVQTHLYKGLDLSVLSAMFNEPRGYGRIIRDTIGQFVGIVEEKDATGQQRSVHEVNTGCYLVKSGLLFDLLDEIGCDNAQGEYYLTDIVGIAMARGLSVEAFPYASEGEALGVNSMYQLACAEKILLNRLRQELMEKGVCFSMPETTYIEPTVEIGQDVFIGPGCVLKGSTVIGDGVILHGMCYLEDVALHSGSVVLPGQVLKGN